MKKEIKSTKTNNNKTKCILDKNQSSFSSEESSLEPSLEVSFNSSSFRGFTFLPYK
jgi:hypothetical protein